MTDPNRILDLRFNGLNPAGDFPDRSGYGFDMADNTFTGDDSELVGGQHGQALSLVPNKFLSYLLQADDVLDFRFGFTYELWLRRTGNLGNRQMILGKTAGVGLTDISAMARFERAPDDNQIRVIVGDGTGIQSVFSLSAIADMNLHHLVMTYDLTTIGISIDGEEVNSGAAPYASLLSCAGSNFEINRYPNLAAEQGNIEYEAIRVYNRPLGAAEISRNFRLGPNRT